MSYDKFAKMVAMGIIRIDADGTISVFDRGMFIMATEMLIKFHELIEKDLDSAKADELMFEIGRYQLLTGSPRFIAKKDELRRAFPQAPKTGDPALEMGRDAIEFMGMGNITIREITKDRGKVILSCPNSPVAREYLKTRGRSKVPACHYLRGVMEGVLEAVYGRPYESREVACIATGISQECIFEFKIR